MPTPLYASENIPAMAVDHDLYAQRAIKNSHLKLNASYHVPKRSGQAWTMKAGQICRIIAIEGPQVVDFNAWNLHDTKERFWASRTRQLVGAHMRPYDQLWSCLPYLRPMMTITDESINYGLDSDGAGCHDLLGTRCDPYIHTMLTGDNLDCCCHSNLLRAVESLGLNESDIHDVLNIFQVTGLTPDTEKYFVKPCPAKKGDYFEFYAEIDLLCAISTCPHGDMSKPIWGPNACNPLEICRPIGIEIYAPE